MRNEPENYMNSMPSPDVPTSISAMGELAIAGPIALAALDAWPARVCVIDDRGRLLIANRAWRELLQQCARESRERSGTDGGCPNGPWSVPCWPRETAQAVDQAVRDILAGRRESYSCEYDCRLGGSEDWRRFAMQVQPLAAAGARMLIMSHDDVTEQRLAEAEHKTLERRMKQLGARMESIREEQTAVIARELHDDLGALLTMLRLDMAITAEKVVRPKWMRVKLGQFVEQAQAALAVLKRISSNLRPATLDTLGLIATIRWYLNQFSQSTGIGTTLQLPEYVRLSDISSIAVFRVIQEALTNVATHAGATRVAVVVSKKVDKLVVEISDDGKGISETAKRKPDSYGILGMRERAAYLGGTLAISSEPGRGTRLVLEIPLDS